MKTMTIFIKHTIAIILILAMILTYAPIIALAEDTDEEFEYTTELIADDPQDGEEDLVEDGYAGGEDEVEHTDEDELADSVNRAEVAEASMSSLDKALPDGEYFQFEVTVSQTNGAFSIPLSGYLNGTWGKAYNWYIDWGDGSSEVRTNTDPGAPQNSRNTAGIPHTYQDGGIYTITITPAGTLDAWLSAFGFYNYSTGTNTQTNRDRLTKLVSIITPLMTRSQSQLDTKTAPSYEWAYTFNECKNLVMDEGFTFSEEWDDIEIAGANFASNMFNGCSGDAFTMGEAFNLPQGLTTVSSYFASAMFSYCNGSAFTMNEVFNIPQSITSVGEMFITNMFQRCSGSAFLVNDIFKFPVLSETDVAKAGVFVFTFSYLNAYSIQNRTAESIINGNPAPSSFRGTFYNSYAFPDWWFIPEIWGGGGLSHSDRSAVAGKVTINGVIGTSLNSRTATVRLTYDMVSKQSISGVDATNWFTGLPSGVTAVANGIPGSETIMFIFGGVPEAVSGAPLAFTIPGEVLASGAALAATVNENAKFNIIDPSIEGYLCVALNTDDSITDEYYFFEDALAGLQDGQTLKLLRNVDYDNTIFIENKSVTFDVNGFSLNVTCTDTMYSENGDALTVGNNGVVSLVGAGASGEFNVVGAGSPAASGVYAYGGGKVMVSSATGLYTGVYSEDSTVEVANRVEGGDYGVYALESVVSAGDVTGKVGLYAERGSKITVNGEITTPAGGKYIVFPSGYRNYADSELASSKPGYREYTDVENYVWVYDSSTEGAAVVSIDASIVDSVYTGLAYDGISNVNADGYDGPFAYLFRGRNSTVYPALNAPPIYAGDYRVTIYVPQGQDCIGVVSYDFTIAPAELTVTAVNMTVSINELSQLKLQYIVSGMVDGESVSAALSKEPHLYWRENNFYWGITTGDYPIYISGGEARPNYRIANYVDGTLTVIRPFDSIEILKKSVVLQKGANETETLDVELYPSPADDTLVWQSNAPTVAAVNGAGVVTAVDEGSAVIIARSAFNDSIYGFCWVSVLPAPSSAPAVLTIKSNDVSIVSGRILDDLYEPGEFKLKKSAQLFVEDKDVTWRSGDTKVATVSAGGLVKYVASGTTTITATVKTGADKGVSEKVILTIRDTTPKLPVGTITVYSLSHLGTKFDILPSDSLKFHTIEISDDTYKFTIIRDDPQSDTFRIAVYDPMSFIKKGKHSVTLQAFNESNEAVGSEFKLTVNVVTSMPKAKIKIATLNTFWKEASGKITVTGKNLPEISDIRLFDYYHGFKQKYGYVAENFQVIEDDDGNYYITAYEGFSSFTDAKGTKPAVKGWMEIRFEGFQYGDYIDMRTITIPIKNQKPKLTVSPKVQNINPSLQDWPYASFKVSGGQIEAVSFAKEQSAFSEYSFFDDNTIYLALAKYNPNLLQKFTAQLDVWLEGARLPILIKPSISTFKANYPESYMLSANSVTLNSTLKNQRQTVQIVSTPSNAIVTNSHITHVSGDRSGVAVVADGPVITVYVAPGTPNKSCSFNITPNFSSKPLPLTVIVNDSPINAGAIVSIKADKGKIDLVNRNNTMITYEPVIKGVTPEILSAKVITDKDNDGSSDFEKFEAIWNPVTKRIEVRAAQGAPFELGNSYSFRFELELESGNRIKTPYVTVTPIQSKVKHTVPKQVPMYQSRTGAAYRQMVKLAPTSPAGARISSLTLKTNPNDAYWYYFDTNEQLLYLWIKDSAMVKPGKSALVFSALYEGQGTGKSGELAPFDIKITVNVLR